ncbi:uncharacterized protein LOC144559154 isoform X1 [Carex rostrata]
MTEIIVLGTALLFSPVLYHGILRTLRFVIFVYFSFLLLLQYALVEEDNVDPLIMTEQIPSPFGVPQVVRPDQAPSPSPSPFLLDQLLQTIPDNYFRINLMISVVGDPQVPYFRIIEAAMDKSVIEIISPVIQRSVKIASQTRKELYSQGLFSGA